MIKKVREQAVTPTRGSVESAGLDISACIDEPFTLEPWQKTLIPTGIAVALPSGTVGLMCGRSGLGTKFGVSLSNGVGVIDSDYRGELHVGLVNRSDTPYVIKPSERIAQLLVVPIMLPTVVLTDSLDETERGENGLGSTGRN